MARRGGADAELLCRLGGCYERIGDPARADDAYCRAIDRDPDFAPAYHAAASLALRGREAAIQIGHGETAETLRLGAYRHVSVLGARLLARGAWREAEAEFRRAAKLAPGDWAAHVNLGQSIYEQGRAADAEAALRHGLNLAPGQALAHCSLGLFLRREGRLDEAEAALRQALELDPGLDPASAELARIAAGPGHYGSVTGNVRTRRPALSSPPASRRSVAPVAALRQAAWPAVPAIRTQRTRFALFVSNVEWLRTLTFPGHRASAESALTQAVRGEPALAADGAAVARCGRARDIDSVLQDATGISHIGGASGFGACPSGPALSELTIGGAVDPVAIRPRYRGTFRWGLHE